MKVRNLMTGSVEDVPDDMATKEISVGADATAAATGAADPKAPKDKWEQVVDLALAKRMYDAPARKAAEVDTVKDIYVVGEFEVMRDGKALALTDEERAVIDAIIGKRVSADTTVARVDSREPRASLVIQRANRLYTA